MATLKDLLARLSSRSEVEAVFVVGQDGLLIDRTGPEGTDEEAVAAMAPNILQSARELGSAAHHEGLAAAVIEYGDGVAVLTDVPPEMIVVTFVKPGVPFSALLYELRRNRDQIAGLV